MVTVELIMIYGNKNNPKVNSQSVMNAYINNDNNCSINDDNYYKIKHI